MVPGNHRQVGQSMSKTRTARNDTKDPTKGFFADNDMIDVAGIFGVLRRRKWPIAAITIAGTTTEFPFFVCMGGDAAIDYTGQDEITFVAIGQGTDSSGAATTIVVSSLDTALGPNHSVLFRIGGGADAPGWQLVGADVAQIGGGRVTAEGDFSRLVAGTPTDDTDPGKLSGTCSPESVGIG